MGFDLSRYASSSRRLPCLAEILAGREARSEAVKRAIQNYPGSTVVELSLAIPGPCKTGPLPWLLHGYLQSLVADTLASVCLQGRRVWQECSASGPASVLVVDALELSLDLSSGMAQPDARQSSPSPGYVKELMVGVEEGSPLARLFDIDVYDAQGNQLHRTSGLRTCLICCEPAAVCARSRTHSMETLYARIGTLMEEDKDFQTFACKPFDAFLPECGTWARHVAHCARKALVAEVNLTPKPGLVDASSQGAHTDMDRYSFTAGALALEAWFMRFVRTGMDASAEECGNPMLVLQRLRPLGREAERAMFAATGGVNTQKGLVFSIGILCAAAGMVIICAGQAPGGSRSWETYLPVVDQTFLDQVRLCAARMCSGIVSRELARDVGTDGNGTYGQRMYRAVQATGARGEAESGFPSVFKAYDSLRTRLEHESLPSKESVHLATLAVLVETMAVLVDTNVLGRKGMDALDHVRTVAAGCLSTGMASLPGLLAILQDMDRDFSHHGISPGGAADILAGALFLHRLANGDLGDLA